MKLYLLFAIPAILLCSCASVSPLGGSQLPDGPGPDTPITQSLFTDKSATISEEAIQRILDGSYKLPAQLRVAIVKLVADEPKQIAYAYYGYRTNENYLKTQQAYLDLLSDKLKQSQKVIKLSVMPDLLISKTPSFTTLREAAVRMQADVVIAYSTASNLYSKFKLFSGTDLKAFATTQLILLDVRTGLIPFSATVTKDVLSSKTTSDLDLEEAQSRVKKEAALLTIKEISDQLITYLTAP